MSIFMIHTRFPNSKEVQRLSAREFVELVDQACLYSRTRDPAHAVPEEFSKFFKFPAKRIWRNKNYDRRMLWERFNGVCYLCGEPVPVDDFHIEHVVPLSRGGADEWDNLNIGHPACNLRKGSRLVSELDWVVDGVA